MGLSDEQLRGLANAAQLYEAWKEVMLPLSRLPGGMYWRVINSREYLYQYASTGAGKQQTKSLGPRTPGAEQAYEEFKRTKGDLEERRIGIEKRLEEFAPAWRALRLPAVDRSAGAVLRALDLAGFVGKSVLVVGTYALKAYEVEAAALFATGMDATEDLDFTLLVDEDADSDLPRRLLLTLRQADSTFIVSPKSAGTAVNRIGYRVDLLTGGTGEGKRGWAGPWKPQVLEGQEWFRAGRPVTTVLIDFDGWPVALAAPDPRYFALHKLWLSNRAGRPAIKRAKDKRQGEALLLAVAEHMPHYPLDNRFVQALPAVLKDAWAAAQH
jgi:hypothetical protein